MNARILVFAVLVSTLVLGWHGSLTAQCTPNGHIFNLEPLTNANILSQMDESIAFLPNRSGHGDDLVVGAALDTRPLNDPDHTFNDAFYAGRNTSDCSAAFDGEFPKVVSGTQVLDPFGSPMVAADPAHDAFFFADLRFAPSPDITLVGILKSTAADLLDTSKCPNGTLQNPGTCFEPVAGGTKVVDALNTFLFGPVIAVDQRKTGIGNGDVYVAVTQDINSSKGSKIQLAITACTNATLLCGNPTFVNGLSQNDVNVNAWIQVRPDGVITVSYQHIIVSNGNENLQYKFVTCTPKGAPNPPTCGAPVLVAQPKNPAIGSAGETGLFSNARPTHVNRLESDGTFTTFLAYEVCDVPAISYPPGFFYCPKVDVVVNFSTDGGKTWSPAEKVSASPGQQFHAAMALDDSTQSVNIAYYSTENDPERLRTQVFLSQILPGSTSLSKPHQLTSTFYDAGVFGSFFSGYGDYISVAAAGTGNAGQSKVYVHFTGTPVDGIYNGRGFPIDTNTLTRFEY